METQLPHMAPSLGMVSLLHSSHSDQSTVVTHYGFNLHFLKSWLIWKVPDAGKEWRQEEKGMTEDEMVGRHHRLNGHEFGWTLGAGDGQGGLACCGPRGCKAWHNWATELNGTEWPIMLSIFSCGCLPSVYLLWRSRCLQTFAYFYFGLLFAYYWVLSILPVFWRHLP